MSNQSMMARINSDVLSQLANGIIPWIDAAAQTSAGFAYNGESGKRYNLLNQLILGQPGAYYTLSAIQRMNDRLHLEGDARVRINNGESPKWVKMWFPVSRRNQHDDDDQQETDDERLDDDSYMMLKTYKVWHESQLVNLPACHSRQTSTSTDWDGLDEFVDAWRINNDIPLDMDSDGSYYNAEEDGIHVDWDYGGERSRNVSNEVHELIHATGHPSRLHRFETTECIMARGAAVNREELVAEMGAAMLAARFGCTLQLAMSREAYIDTWTRVLTANPSMYCTAATRAEKAAKLIAPDLFPDLVTLINDEPNVEEIVDVATAQAIVEPRVSCRFCGADFPESSMTSIGDQLFCPECAPHIYFCSGCAELRHDQGVSAVHLGHRFCQQCEDSLFPRWNAHYQHMHGRYGEPSLHFHGDTNHYMGVEIETSPDTDRPDVYNIDRAAGELSYMSDKYDGEPLWHMTTDATINNNLGHGIEVVSHPADIGWWMSHNAIDDFHTIMHGAGFMSHESLDRYGLPTCGLHVHINRRWFIDGMRLAASEGYEEEVVIAKFMAAVQSMLREGSSKSGWSTLERFARRKCNSWCADPGFDSMSLSLLDRRTNVTLLHSWMNNHGRYHVVNLNNDNTVEMRIFRGTTKASTIKATLQFVNNLVEFVRHRTVAECQVCSLRDVINYQHWDELEAYAASKNL